jgi:hypothetical protein
LEDFVADAIEGTSVASDMVVAPFGAGNYSKSKMLCTGNARPEGNGTSFSARTPCRSYGAFIVVFSAASERIQS